ncbi:bacillithiol system redox-active protein YtxJ [Flavobacterium capsici]|uniref:Bacillithiol system redox-active protein YtxJ n=1 Tax=Flavobacterium capsici TaxID=3075618 RepID=A0AA96J5U7_9FLAO|nr:MULTISPECIES: bacillithiol system redox-active protein YtxJ [unclassified Flavobacterium]WNM17951.1 bacillithiol system redox-active protein YtxJ [Flavobacterium sp. PMR2A8]WNM22003.1 bacillithiol system redox-active protein YtxJ [Flavobacterium sp. PMTSA4]
MSFLNNLFGKNKAEELPDVYWSYLEHEQQLEEINQTSFQKPVVIFKHSTGCGISRMSWNQFQKDYNIPNDKMELYYLDLLAYRSISNAIAEKYGVEHQSPQILVIKDGAVVFHTSHESIDAKDLEEYVND